MKIKCKLESQLIFPLTYFKILLNLSQLLRNVGVLFQNRTAPPARGTRDGGAVPQKWAEPIGPAAQTPAHRRWARHSGGLAAWAKGPPTRHSPAKS